MAFDFYMHEWTETDANVFTDCFAGIKLLAKDNNDEAKEKHKELVYGKFKVKKGEVKIKPIYKKGVIDKGLNFLDGLSVRKPTLDISTLPPFTFFLQFTFKLATPYLSKDDDQFYPCDNPIRKDKVFKVPMVSASTWKGSLRWTAMKIFTDRLPEKKEEAFEKRAQLVRLFGHEKDSIERHLDTIFAERFGGGVTADNINLVNSSFLEFLKQKGYRSDKVEGRAGRLYFYPTFFDDIGLEVINPHDRKTKAGIQPIYIESVPIGASGTFSLLYVPFDLIGKPEVEVKEEVSEDLRLICNALKGMMLTYGFSAKKSSGLGIVKDDFNIPEHPEAILNIKLDAVKPYKFENFTALTKTFNEIISMLGGRDNCPEISEVRI